MTSHTPGVEEIIEEFRRKIGSCTHVDGFHTCVLDDPQDNETYKEVATDWFRQTLTTLTTKHAKELEKAVEALKDITSVTRTDMERWGAEETVERLVTRAHEALAPTKTDKQ